MSTRTIAVISATVALLTVGILTRAQAPAGQAGQPARGGGAPPGRGPALPPLSQTKWETWNNTGLRGIPQNVDPDGPAPKRDLTGIWDPARGGIGARGVAVFGPTDPLQWRPLGEGIRVLHAPQPCRRCGADRFCTHRLAVADVVAALTAQL